MPRGVPRNNSTQHTILHRLKIIRGHMDSVIKMVESGSYCIDIIHQSLAIQTALKKTDDVILKNHLQHCVAEAIAKGNKDEVIDEVMKVMYKK